MTGMCASSVLNEQQPFTMTYTQCMSVGKAVHACTLPAGEW